MEREAMIGLVISTGLGLFLLLGLQFVPQTTPELSPTALVSSQSSPGDAIKAFHEAGLPAEEVQDLSSSSNPVELAKADQGIQFTIPRGQNAQGFVQTEVQGRILSFPSDRNREDLKEAYEAIGDYWMYEHENLLLRIDKDLSEEEAQKYEQALKRVS